MRTWLVVACLFAGCSAGREAEGVPASSPAVPPAPPVAVNEAIARAQAGFWRDGDGFVAATSRRPVRVSGQGAIAWAVDATETVFAVETREVRVGPRRLLRPGGGAALRDGLVSIPRGGGVEELLEGRGDGLEQRWRFERHPGSPGQPLVVEVEVTGGPLHATTASGLHFGAPGQGLLRYGAATWVDASGRRTPVEATVRGARVVLNVPAQVLDATAWPAELDPLITQERQVDLPTVGPTFGAEDLADVAFGGGQYLAVWASRPEFSGNETVVMAARLDFSGAVLQRMRVFASQWGGARPFVASDGASFLVVGTNSAGDLQVASVAADGTVSPPRTYPSASNFRDLGGLAAGGSGFLAVWSEGATPSREVKAARYDATGAQQGNVIDLSTAAGDQHSPRVAFDGADAFLVAWVDEVDRSIHETMVSSSGSVLGTGAVTDAGVNHSPSLGFHGGGYHLAWYEETSGQPVVVNVSVAGVAGPPLSIPLLASMGPVRVLGGAGSSLLLFADPADGSLRGSRVTSAGQALDTTPLVLVSSATRDASQPAGAWDATRGRWLTAWTSTLRGNQILVDKADLRAGFLAASTGAFSRLQVNLAEALRGQSLPALAWSPRAQRFLAVWTDLGSELPMIRGILFDRSGAAVSAPLEIAQDAYSLLGPVVASNGLDFAVSWSTLEQGTSVKLKRVAADGGLLDSVAIDVSPPSPGWAHGPAISRTKDDDYLVTWLDGTRDLGCAGFLLLCGDVAAARLNAATGQVSWRTATSTWARALIRGPSPTFDGTGQHLVLANSFPVDGGLPQVTAISLDVNGAEVGAPRDLYMHPLAFPAAARGAGDTLIAFPFALPDAGDPWGNEGVPVFGAGIGLARLDRDGGLSPLRIDQGLADGGYNQLPNVAWDGRDWVVSWVRARGLFVQEDNTVLMQRYDGTTLDPVGPQVVLGGPSNLLQMSAIASDGEGTTAVAYVGSSDGGTPRIMVRLAYAYPRGHACSQGQECRDGACVSGVCCDAPCTGACQTCLASEGASADGVCSPRPSSSECRASASACDAPERCSGTSPDCPADGSLPDDTACGAATACAAAAVCRAGACTAGAPTVCAPLDECHEAGACVEPGGCAVGAARPDGTACEGGACQAGVCTAPPPVVEPPRVPRSFVSCLACSAVPPQAFLPFAWLLVLWRSRRGGRR